MSAPEEGLGTDCFLQRRARAYTPHRLETDGTCKAPLFNGVAQEDLDGFVAPKRPQLAVDTSFTSEEDAEGAGAEAAAGDPSVNSCLCSEGEDEEEDSAARRVRRLRAFAGSATAEAAAAALQRAVVDGAQQELDELLVEEGPESAAGPEVAAADAAAGSACSSPKKRESLSLMSPAKSVGPSSPKRGGC